MKTHNNTWYHIEKWTDNIVEITKVNGYITTNIVHYTSYLEDAVELLKQFNDALGNEEE